MISKGEVAAQGCCKTLVELRPSIKVIFLLTLFIVILANGFALAQTACWNAVVRVVPEVTGRLHQERVITVDAIKPAAKYNACINHCLPNIITP